jgi:hypothetical protein
LVATIVKKVNVAKLDSLSRLESLAIVALFESFEGLCSSKLKGKKPKKTIAFEYLLGPTVRRRVHPLLRTACSGSER